VLELLYTEDASETELTMKSGSVDVGWASTSCECCVTAEAWLSDGKGLGARPDARGSAECESSFLRRPEGRRARGRSSPRRLPVNRRAIDDLAQAVHRAGGQELASGTETALFSSLLVPAIVRAARER
jgi:hypothetical protein